MKQLKILVLIITLITGVTGLLISNPHANGISDKNSEYTSGEIASAQVGTTPTVRPEPTFVAETPDTNAMDVEHKLPDESTGGDPDEDGEIDVPEIIIADMDDEEDPQRNKNNTVEKVEAYRIDVARPVLPTAAPFPSGGGGDGSEEYTIIAKKGIDVSKWNGDIDWKKVADEGVEFAIIRTGYRGCEGGNIVADPCFYDNIEGALANGIEVGVYFYSQAINEKEARQEAAWVCELIKNYNITYPVAYDLEEITYGRINTVKYSQFNKNAEAFLSYVESKGYRGSLYSCKSYLEDMWSAELQSMYHIWLAHYSDITDFKGRYDMWQHSKTGRISGISYAVDLDYAYFVIKNEKPAAEPTKEPVQIATRGDAE